MNAKPRRGAGWRMYAHVLAPSLIVVLLVGMLAMSSVKALGAVRAYVGGESLWSKARSDAVQHLRNYALSRNRLDYVLYERALDVPMGDRQAREEMERPHMNGDKVRASLLIGGIHPGDIDSMVLLFRWFGRESLFKDSLGTWQYGDGLIEQLRAQANLLKQQIEQDAGESAIMATVSRIDSEPASSARWAPKRPDSPSQREANTRKRCPCATSATSSPTSSNGATRASTASTRASTCSTNSPPGASSAKIVHPGAVSWICADVRPSYAP